jgi:hypothetical protein
MASLDGKVALVTGGGAGQRAGGPSTSNGVMVFSSTAEFLPRRTPPP